jgi:hypothetical protein
MVARNTTADFPWYPHQVHFDCSTPDESVGFKKPDSDRSHPEVVSRLTTMSVVLTGCLRSVSWAGPSEGEAYVFIWKHH